MLRKSVRVIGAGVILIAASLFVLEFVMSDFVFPRPAIWQLIAFVAAVLAVLFLGNKDEVIHHHLPH